MKSSGYIKVSSVWTHYYDTVSSQSVFGSVGERFFTSQVQTTEISSIFSCKVRLTAHFLLRSEKVMGSTAKLIPDMFLSGVRGVFYNVLRVDLFLVQQLTDALTGFSL